MSKPTKAMIIEQANEVWPLSRYDTEGRAMFDKLSAAKNKSPKEFKKWTPLDQYLVLTHFPEMRKQFAKQGRDREKEEEEKAAVNQAREARLERHSSSSKRAQSAAAETGVDETFQRREVINVNLIDDDLLQ